MSSERSFLPIALGLSAGALRGREEESSALFDSLDEDQRAAVFERDDHTCRYCGFRSEKYQMIRDKDGNPKGRTLDSLVTACIFCHQCFQLEQVAGMKSGTLIWLPEMSQAHLHHLARAIYVARITQGPMADAARKALDILMQRREDAQARIHTDDPFILSAVLSDYVGRKTYESSAGKLEGIRLFPLDRRMIHEGDLEFNQFPQILAYWRSKDGPFGGRLPTIWLDLYKDAIAQAA